MDVLLTHCAGLDVHTKRRTACRLMPDPTGPEVAGLAEVQPCGTCPLEWLALADWLAAAGMTHGGMESPGESGPPVETPWEGSETVVVVHAAQGTHGPGRTTDTADARWRATCLPLARGTCGSGRRWSRHAAAQSSASQACWRAPIARWPRGHALAWGSRQAMTSGQAHSARAQPVKGPRPGVRG